MGIVKRAADLAFTFRFLRMLVMKWESWDAYKLGIIDDSGKRDRSVKLDTDEKKSAYTPFIRLAANVKRLVGQNKLTSLASALFLIREIHSLSDKDMEKILKESGIDFLDFLAESNEWFILEDKRMSPGVYRVKDSKVLNTTFEELVQPKDQVKFLENSYPIGEIFGLDIYEAIHVRSNQKVYVAAGELVK
jgi:hypothetical protein